MVCLRSRNLYQNGAAVFWNDSAQISRHQHFVGEAILFTSDRTNVHSIEPFEGTRHQLLLWFRPADVDTNRVERREKAVKEFLLSSSDLRLRQLAHVTTELALHGLEERLDHRGRHITIQQLMFIGVAPVEARCITAALALHTRSNVLISHVDL